MAETQDLPPEESSGTAPPEDRGERAVDSRSGVADLDDGGPLTADDAEEIVRESGGELIVLAGLEGTGKTTLLASVYETFLTGDFAKCSFFRSRTLRAFEDRCHKARVAGGHSLPTTPRTEQSEGLQLLHLGIQARWRTPQRVNLLFADMAGEYFRRARDSAEECRRLTILRRTDHLVLLVDGQLLSDRRQRQVALRDAKLLLRRFIECEMIGKLTAIQVVVSKWDLVVSGESELEVEERLTEVEEDVRQAHDRQVRALWFGRAAASPIAKPDLKIAYGVENMFTQWVTAPAWPAGSCGGGAGRGTEREAYRFGMTPVLEGES